VRGQDLALSGCKITQLTDSPEEVWLEAAEDAEGNKYLSGVTLHSNSFAEFVDYAGFKNSLLAANRNVESNQPFQSLPKETNVALLANHEAPTQVESIKSLETPSTRDAVDTAYSSEDKNVIENNR